MPIDYDSRSMTDVILEAILLLLPPKQLCGIIDIISFHIRYFLHLEPCLQQVSSSVIPLKDRRTGLSALYVSPDGRWCI